MNKHLKNLIKAAIGLSILLFLFYKIGFKEVYISIISMNTIYIPWIISAFAIFLLLNVVNMYILVRAITDKVRFSEIFKYALWGWGYGKFLPGKVGEFSVIYFLRKKNISIGEGTVIVILDKIISFIVLFLIALFAFFIFFEKILALKMTVFVLILFVVGLLLLFSGRGRRLIKYVLGKYKQQFTGFSRTIYFMLKEKKGPLFLDFLVTIFRWGIYFFTVWLLFFSFNVNLPFFILASVVAAMSIGAMIPITMGGIGVKESIGILFLLKYGISSSISGGVFLIAAVIGYVFAVIFVFSQLFNKP